MPQQQPAPLANASLPLPSFSGAAGAIGDVREVIGEGFSPWVMCQEKVCPGATSRRPSEAQAEVIRRALLGILDGIANNPWAAKTFESIYEQRTPPDWATREIYDEKAVSQCATLLLSWKSLDERRRGISRIELETLIKRQRGVCSKLMRRTHELFPAFAQLERKVREGLLLNLSSEPTEQDSPSPLQDALGELIGRTQRKMEAPSGMTRVEVERLVKICGILEFLQEARLARKKIDLADIRGCLKREKRLSTPYTHHAQGVLREAGLMLWREPGCGYVIDWLPQEGSADSIAELIREVEALEGG